MKSEFILHARHIVSENPGGYEIKTNKTGPGSPQTMLTQ